MCISMATRSVCEHPGRFLVSILEGFMDKLCSEKSHAGLLVRPSVYIFDHHPEGRTCSYTTLLFDMDKLSAVRARDQ